jgi:hypothetical protein
VLAWRQARQLLEPRGAKGIPDVVRRLAGVQSQVGSQAELAIAVRRRATTPTRLDRPLWRDRSLIKTWAMRGTLHVLAADEAPAFVAALSTVQPWRAKAWETYFGVTAREVERINAAIAEALEDRVLTREELGAEVAAKARVHHHAERLSSGWAELLKPAAFQGLLCQGPPDGTRVTFTRPDTWVKGWRSVDPVEGGAAVVRAYLGAHGPATIQEFAAWFARLRPPHVRPWFEALGEELVTVDVEGRVSVALASDLASLRRQRPSTAVRMLPGFDQYVLAAGRDVVALFPAGVKPKVSRTAGWISPVVTLGGRIAGVWELDDREIRVEAFESIPRRALETEARLVGRLAGAPDASLVVQGPGPSARGTRGRHS